MIAHTDEAMTLAEVVHAEGQPGVLVSSHRPWHDGVDETFVHLAHSSNINISMRQGKLVHIQPTGDVASVIEQITKNAPGDRMNPDGMKAHATFDHVGIVPLRKAAE